MTREVITDRTGLHRVQQRRYEQREHIRRTPNYAYYRVEKKIKDWEYKPLKQLIFTKLNGHRQINKRLGNIYHSQQQPSSRGMLWRVNAELNGFSISAEAPTLIKRYFQSFKRLAKGLLRATRTATEGFYLINQTYRHKRGRMEWCYVTNYA